MRYSIHTSFFEMFWSLDHCRDEIQCNQHTWLWSWCPEIAVLATFSTICCEITSAAISTKLSRKNWPSWRVEKCSMFIGYTLLTRYKAKLNWNFFNTVFNSRNTSRPNESSIKCPSSIESAWIFREDDTWSLEGFYDENNSRRRGAKERIGIAYVGPAFRCRRWIYFHA